MNIRFRKDQLNRFHFKRYLFLMARLEIVRLSKGNKYKTQLFNKNLP